jgi:hypothetical protein
MVQLVRFDLQFVLDQILLAESGQSPPTAFHPWGIRTVNGTFNHIIPGQELWGSADQNFPRLLTPTWRGADGGTSYLQTSGTVIDTQPRLISNLIVDQTANNPAAIAAAFGLVGLTGADQIPLLQQAPLLQRRPPPPPRKPRPRATRTPLRPRNRTPSMRMPRPRVRSRR